MSGWEAHRGAPPFPSLQLRMVMVTPAMIAPPPSTVPHPSDSPRKTVPNSTATSGVTRGIRSTRVTSVCRISQ